MYSKISHYLKLSMQQLNNDPAELHFQLDDKDTVPKYLYRWTSQEELDQYGEKS